MSYRRKSSDYFRPARFTQEQFHRYVELKEKLYSPVGLQGSEKAEFRLLDFQNDQLDAYYATRVRDVD